MICGEALFKGMAESESSIGVFLSDPRPSNFSAVVDENIGMLRRFVYRIVLNEHDTDDIVQESFLMAYNKIASFNGRSKFSTWLCRIAYNLSISLLRDRKRLGLHDGLENSDKIASIKSNETADGHIHNSERMEIIMKTVAALPEHLRAAITLTAIEDRAMDEAAYILGCSKARLYWRLHKARKMLEKNLGDMLK